MGAGAATAICKLLQSPFAAVQENAAGCIYAFSPHPKFDEALLSAGCVPLLVGLLSSSSADVQNWSSQAILKLSDGHSVNAAALCDAGAVGALVRVVRQRGGEAQKQACAVRSILEVEPPQGHRNLGSPGQHLAEPKPSGERLTELAPRRPFGGEAPRGVDAHHLVSEQADVERVVEERPGRARGRPIEQRVVHTLRDAPPAAGARGVEEAVPHRDSVVGVIDAHDR